MGQLISPKTTHTNNMATWSDMSMSDRCCLSVGFPSFYTNRWLLNVFSVTEEDEAVANNTGWSPRGTPNFDLSGSGKLNGLNFTLCPN